MKKVLIFVFLFSSIFSPLFCEEDVGVASKSSAGVAKCSCYKPWMFVGFILAITATGLVLVSKNRGDAGS